MPFSYEIDPNGRLTTVAAVGETTEDERDDIARTIIEDPRFSPGSKILIDRTQARDVGDLPRVERMMVRLGALLDSVRGSKIAYVGG